MNVASGVVLFRSNPSEMSFPQLHAACEYSL